ncbi:hypothetical protein PFISCL1PPCAC_2602, partial [Pristionchus fissidentatus]
ILQVPGLKSYPLIGSAWQFNWDSAGNVGSMLHYYKILSSNNEQKTKTFQLWVGPIPMIYILKPEYCKQVLESNTLITKATEYDKLTEWIGTGLL